MSDVCHQSAGGAGDTANGKKRTVLFVTTGSSASLSGGRALLSTLLWDALSEIDGVHATRFEVPKVSLQGWSAVAAVFNGHIDGVSPIVARRLLDAVREVEADFVFLDGSNIGVLARAIKERSPSTPIITFFHNCEARFFLGALRDEPSVRRLGVLVANYRAERLAVNFSNSIVCLNQRDSLQLGRVYGRGASHVLPMAMHDRLPSVLPASETAPGERYALFVGGTFYANRQAIEWFVEHVAHCAAMKTIVVGNGFEKFKSELERNGNVEVVGSVESVVPWYLGAQVVLAPIFDGSGMKTKVAEALMFGKRVIGTSEAFVGYEDIVGRAGVVCGSASEFSAALEAESVRPSPGVDPELRALYLAKYSFQSAREGLARVLGG